MQSEDRRLRIGLLTLTAALLSSAAQAQQASPVSPSLLSAAEAPSQQSGSGGSFLDKAQAWAKEHQLMERFNGEIDGWYPRIGRMTRGGGIALGPGYRFHPLGGPVLVDLSAAISIKAYKAVDANVRWFQSANERFEFWTDYRFEEFPQEDYFGRGLDSSLDTRTSYEFQSNDFLARGLFKATPWWNVGGNIGYMFAKLGPGSDSNYPSIEEIFGDIEAPGLLTKPDYLHSTVFTEIDTRDVKGNPGSGGFYRASFGVWNDRSLDLFNFWRFQMNLNQFVPLESSKKHVLFGRVGLAYVNNDATSRVPFYFLPYVGGVDTIRSFREFRFRDENAMWLGAEYLFRPIPYIGLAAFFDAGKVAEDWQDINFSDLKQGYGFGLRFGTAKQQLGRMDFGFGGGEGTRVFFKFGTSL